SDFDIRICFGFRASDFGFLYTFGIWNGFRLTGLVISPLRMALTATRIVLTVPLISTFTRWRFGLNRRLVMPVTFRPTPPRYLALPRRRILLPPTGFLPVIAHCMPMTTVLHLEEITIAIAVTLTRHAWRGAATRAERGGALSQRSPRSARVAAPRMGIYRDGFFSAGAAGFSGAPVAETYSTFASLRNSSKLILPDPTWSSSFFGADTGGRGGGGGPPAGGAAAAGLSAAPVRSFATFALSRS